MRYTTFVLVATPALVAIAAASCKQQESPSAPAAAETVAGAPAAPGAARRSGELEPYSCGTVQRLHTWNGIFAGSQPAAEDLRHAKENGVKTILNLRPKSEDVGFDEQALVAELGMEYHNLPFATAADLTDDVFDSARSLLRDESKRPVFFHCHSGNRVGAVWFAFRVLDGGQTIEAALDEARQVGLKAPALEQRAREYVERLRTADASH